MPGALPNHADRNWLHSLNRVGVHCSRCSEAPLGSFRNVTVMTSRSNPKECHARNRVAPLTRLSAEAQELCEPDQQISRVNRAPRSRIKSLVVATIWSRNRSPLFKSTIPLPTSFLWIPEYCLIVAPKNAHDGNCVCHQVCDGLLLSLRPPIASHSAVSRHCCCFRKTPG